MEQFDKDGQHASYEDVQNKKALKKSHRRGMIKGMALMLVICIVVAAIGNGGFRAMRETRIGVPVTNADGTTDVQIQTYESLLDQETIQKINYLAATIQAYYYEEVDRDALLEGLYSGLFESLDIYSEYFTLEDYNELYNMNIVGNYCGIGATLSQNVNTMVVEVVNVQKDSPAEEAGIREGDKILRADEYDAMTMNLDEFVTHLRGEEGTSVHVEVYREASEENLEFDIVRAELDIQSVEYEMLEDKIGYIQISQFMGATTEQFTAAVLDLQLQGMESLIVDLRGNPGGLLDSVIEILGIFVQEGLLMYTEDKYGNRQDFMAEDDITKIVATDVPLAVLVDEHSASASEIFAGAIKDYQLGTLIGTTTYGKGIVQSLSTMEDGSGFKLTTSRYYTPSGVCIHGTGITPDVELEYEFLGEESAEYAYEYDNQLQRAVELLQK